MHGTRERIIELVVRRREARVEDLADELGITPAAVRRHLDNLRADGLVDVRAVKQATGRPYYAYFATGKEAGAGSAAYAELLERMLRGLGEQAEAAAVVMQTTAESLAEKHRRAVEAVPCSTAEERVERVTESLRGDGILDEWRRDADGYHMLNAACPYHKAAEISRLPCESDRIAIELLVGLAVEQLHRIVDGAPICEYLVRPASEPAQQLIETR